MSYPSLGVLQLQLRGLVRGRIARTSPSSLGACRAHSEILQLKRLRAELTHYPLTSVDVCLDAGEPAQGHALGSSGRSIHVFPGEPYRKGCQLTEAQADILLRKDLKKFCSYYCYYGKDSVLLGALAYNIGPGY